MTRKIELFEHQREVIAKLKTGSILCGGVGSGKSLTALTYFYEKVYPKDLYIITTAKKRDSLDWEREAAYFLMSTDRDLNPDGVRLFVDSWNNIRKYVKKENAFFIFDEQRVIGRGSWVRSFLKIVKKNDWVLLTATPGDTWMDYIPAFVANGFYKNRTEFIQRHVVYNTFTKFPKIDHYVEEARLERLKREIVILMPFVKKTVPHWEHVMVSYDKTKFDMVSEDRWNPYTDKPIKEVGEYYHTMRKIVNSDPSRFEALKKLVEKHRRLIIFYNFDYELEILRGLNCFTRLGVAEYNGHKHEDIPISDRGVYLVQYLSGAEGWNCIETNVVVFYSLNYSFRIMTQAAGRIDRLNTPYVDLFYYTLRSASWIDTAVLKALKQKKDFNQYTYEFATSKFKPRQKHML